MARPTLQELGEKYGTDKATRHSYLPTYDLLLTRLCDDPIHLLEVGVEEGRSLRMWREYFPQAEIIGIDNDRRKRWGEVEGCLVVVVDSCRFNPTVLGNKQFEVIIDDGSHEPEDQCLTLCNLWSHLAHGGLYFIEDVRPESLQYLAVFEGLVIDLRHVKDTPDDILIIKRKP